MRRPNAGFLQRASAPKRVAPVSLDQSKIRRVMREYERGELRTSSGATVTSREQAIAIALSEARRARAKERHDHTWRDRLHGGLADKKRPSEFNQRDLRAGMRVEREHATDPHIQREIAMDHLTEDPQYYQKLRRVEKK